MPFIIADRVRETSTTVGTGSIALAGAATGYRTFGSVLASTDTTFYTIADQGGPNWEVGIGTFTAPSTLARTTVLSSSNGGSLVNFTSGTKDVFISLTASRTNVSDQPNVIDTSSSSAALRITQTGSGNAILVEDSANPDSSPFVVDANGNVGVGTLSPSERLTVSGNIQLQSTGQINFFSTGYFVRAASGLELQSFDFIRLLTNGANERMRIDAAGNVGIGTSLPTFRLVAANSSTDGGWLYSSGAVSILGLGGYGGATDGAFSLRYDRAAGAVTFNGGSRDTPVERMRIDSVGNVGIGTSSPGTRLDVSGSIRASQSITIGNGGGTYQAGSIYSDGNWGMLFRAAQASPALALFRWSDASDVERMRMDTSGNVGIGTSAPVARLDLGSIVHGNPSTGVTASFWTNGVGDNYGIGVSSSQLNYISSTTGANSHVWHSAGSERMRINSSGNLLVNTTTSVSRLTVNGDVSGTFFVNPTTVSANYTIPTNHNAMTAGPITVNSGVVVTVPSGSTWTIL